MGRLFVALAVVVVALLAPTVDARMRRFPGHARRGGRSSARSGTPAPKITYFTQPIDHLNPEATQATYQQRILTYNGFWSGVRSFFFFFFLFPHFFCRETVLCSFTLVTSRL